MLALDLFRGASSRLVSRGLQLHPVTAEGEVAPGRTWRGTWWKRLEVSFGAVSNTPVAAWVLPALPARAFP